jgi:hypothetical protein
MTIDWSAFLTVVVGSLVAACLLVTLFSLGLRLNDGTEAWRRPVSVAVFVVCAVVVVIGIYLIVPIFHF